MSNAERTAVVLMAYGTPRTKEEILPYYTDIRRGRPPTEEALQDLLRQLASTQGLRHFCKALTADGKAR